MGRVPEDCGLKIQKRGANTAVVAANKIRAKVEWVEGEDVGGGLCQVTQTPLGGLIKFSTFPHSH